MVEPGQSQLEPSPSPPHSGGYQDARRTTIFERGWQELVVENPVLEESVREQRKFFKTASEGSKTGPRIIIGIALFFYAWLVVQASLAHEDGTEVFSYIELIALTLVLPGSIYGAISGERERSTWEALVLTRLTPAQIVAGKLLWRLRMMLYIAGIVLIPMLVSRVSDTHSDDITGGSVWMSQAMILSWGILLSTFSLWASSCTKRSVTTLAIVAVTLIGLLIALPTLYSIFAGIQGDDTHDSVLYQAITAFNPFTVLGLIFRPDSAGYRMDGAAGTELGSGFYQTVVWLLLSGLFVKLSCDKLRQMEEPKRRGE